MRQSATLTYCATTFEVSKFSDKERENMTVIAKMAVMLGEPQRGRSLLTNCLCIGGTPKFWPTAKHYYPRFGRRRCPPKVMLSNR